MTEEDKTYLTLLGHSPTGIQIISVRMKLGGKTMGEVLDDMAREWIEVNSGTRKNARA